MNLKILLINQRQIKWLNKIDKKLISKYESIEIILLNNFLKLKKKDVKFYHPNIKIKEYQNLEFKKDHLHKLFDILVKNIRLFLEDVNKNKEIKKIVSYRQINLTSILANDIFVLYYRDFLIFTAYLKKIILQDKLSDFLTFGNSALRFHCPERLDLSPLFDNELVYYHLIKKICKELNVVLITVSRFVLLFSPIKFYFRSVLITLLKFSKIFSRLIMSRVDSLYQKPFLEKNKKKVGIILRAEAEYYAIKPIIEKIKGDKRLQGIILQGDLFLHPQTRKLLKTKYEKFISLYSLTSFFGTCHNFFIGLKKKSKFRKFLKRLSLEDITFTTETEDKFYFNILCKSSLFKEMLLAISTFWPETMVFINQLNKFISDYKPQVLISMGMIDHWVATASLLSGQYKLPIVSFQTAALPSHSLPSFIFSDKFLVNGSKIKKDLVAWGNEPNKIIVIGDPKYDKYISYLNKDSDDFKKEIRKKMNLPINKKILVTMTQPQTQTRVEELIKITIKFLEQHSNVHGIIKIHPRESLNDYSFYQKMIENKKINLEIRQKINVVDLIFVADVVLAKTSSTILSALILNVPPIIFVDSETSFWLENLEYLKTDATKKVNSEEEAIFVLEDIVDNKEWLEQFKKNREVFLNTFIGPLDSLATHRAIEIIESVISHKL